MKVNWSSSFIADTEENKREEKGELIYSYHSCFGFLICRLEIIQTGYFNLEFGKAQENDYRIQTHGTHKVHNYDTLDVIASLIPEGSLLNGYEKDKDNFLDSTHKTKNYFGKVAEYWHQGDVLWCMSQDINKDKVLPKFKLHKFSEDEVISLKKDQKVFILKGSVDIDDNIFTHETRRQIKVVSENGKDMTCLSDGYLVYVEV